jgi:hypothetical protein
MKPLPSAPVELAAQRLAPLLIPFPHPSPLEQGRAKEIKWTLGWEAPKEIIVCGGWPVLGSYRKGRKIAGTKEVEVNAVDLAVVMPDVSRAEAWQRRADLASPGNVHTERPNCVPVFPQTSALHGRYRFQFGSIGQTIKEEQAG